MERRSRGEVEQGRQGSASVEAKAFAPGRRSLAQLETGSERHGSAVAAPTIGAPAHQWLAPIPYVDQASALAHGFVPFDASGASGGAPLPGALRGELEAAVGQSLDGVRVHDDGASHAAAKSMGAHAFAVGQHMHFGAGVYDPSSSRGRHIIAHEIAHTVQQRGQEPTIQGKLETTTPGDAAEREADRFADAFGRGMPVAVQPGTSRALIARFGPDDEAPPDRDGFLGGLRRQPDGRWTYPDGRPLNREHQAQLRSLVPADDYQRHVQAQLDHEHARIAGAAGNTGPRGPRSTGLHEPAGDWEHVPHEGQAPDAPAHRRTLPTHQGANSQQRPAADGQDPIVLVDQGDEVRTRGSQPASTRGLYGCTGIAVDGPQSDRRLAHVSEDDDAVGPLAGAIARSTPQSGGGVINAHVNVNSDHRAPGAERPFPRDHRALLETLRDRLQAEYDAEDGAIAAPRPGQSTPRPGRRREVRVDGNDLVVHTEGGEPTRIRVGVTERARDAAGEPIHTEMTQTPHGVRTQPHGQPAEHMDHETAAGQGHEQVDDDARNLRRVLEQRASDPQRTDDERALARAGIANLDARPRPTAQDVQETAHAADVSEDEIRSGTTRPAASGGSGSGGSGSGGSAPTDPSAHPTASPHTASGHDSAAPTDTATSPRPASGASRRHPGHGTTVATTGGEEPIAPPRLPAHVIDPGAEDEAEGSASADREGFEIEPTEGTSMQTGVGPDGGHLGATHGRHGMTGRLEETEGGGRRSTLEVERELASPDGRRRSVQGGISEERGPDGQVRGHGATLGGGSGDVQASAGASYTCYADRPQQDPSNARRWTVAWRVQITREFAAEYHIGFSTHSELERSGVEVFLAESDSQADRSGNERRAREWGQDFPRRNAHQVAELFASGTAAHDTGLDFWTNAPVSTERTVRTQYELSVSLAVPIFQLFEVGGQYEARAQDTATIVKVDAEHVHVTQIVEVREGGSIQGGTGGATLESGTAVIDTVTVVTKAHLTSGAAAIRSLLADGTNMDPDQPGVQLLERRRNHAGSEDRRSAGFGTLTASETGRVDHETGRRFNEETGQWEDIDVYHGQHESDAEGGGLEQHGSFQVDAPAAGNANYVIRQVIRGNTGVRDELATATGQGRSQGLGSGRGSGQWTVIEELTQEEVARFCDNYVDRYEELHGGDDLEHRGESGRLEFFGVTVPGGSPYDALYHQLRGLRGAGPAASQRIRARAIAEFLEGTGQQGVDVIRHGAGAPRRQTITHQDREGREDPNFMTPDEHRQLRESISRWTSQVDESDLAADQASALADQIETQLTRMRERRAGLDDQQRYGTLPLAERERMIAEYERYIEQLQGLLSRARRGGDAATAGRYDGQAQGQFADMQRERERAEQLEAEVEERRRFTIEHRRHFGQEVGERHESRLGPNAQRETSQLWRQAEANRTAAEEEMRIARQHFEEARSEHAQQGQRFSETMGAIYATTREDYVRACSAYEQARDQLGELNRMYQQLRNNEHDAPVTAPADANRTEPSGNDDAQPRADGAQSPADGRSTASTDTERSAARRDRSPRGRAAGEHARTPEGTDRATAGPRAMSQAERRRVIDLSVLRQHIQIRRGVGVRLDHDGELVMMPSGVGGHIVGVHHPQQSPTSIEQDGLAVEVAFQLTVAPPSIDHFEVPDVDVVPDVSGGPDMLARVWRRVECQAGTRFELLYYDR